MAKYPTFIDIRLWKKCVPWEGSIPRPSNPVSTMTFALHIWIHLTGTPKNLSLEPQRPGPIRIYSRFCFIILELRFSISISISIVFVLSNLSGSRKMMSLISVITPFPIPFSVYIKSFSLFTVSGSRSTSSVLIARGRIWSK